MSLGSPAATLALGFLLGLRHATEADHLVAVSTIVSERRSLLTSALVGVYWGIGHTATLFAAGVLVFALGLAISDQVAVVLELAVAAMIVALGVRLLWVTGAAPSPAALRTSPGWKPVVVGMVHGLAGSAALTVLIQAELALRGRALAALVYLLIFGIGSIVGMLVMGGVIGLPFVIGAGVSSRLIAGLQRVAGIGSVAFGLYYAYRTAGAFLPAV